MKNKIIIAFALASAFTVMAQESGERPGRPPGGPGGPGGPRGGRGGPPLIMALDVNKDGKIDASELANAPKILAALDKNGDGKITMDELRPPRPADAPEPPADAPKRPAPPFFAALDTDKDGSISAAEMANAATALAKLDKNGDGVLTPDEIMGMPRGEGREGGERRGPRDGGGKDGQGGPRGPRGPRPQPQQ
jgi:hypothetical protein